MSTVERIQELLDCVAKVPLYDQSGKIINPAGVEATVEARAIKRCLKIAEEEKIVINQSIADKAFLALTIWREARGESADVQTGIAHVILNRVRRPSWWGTDVMSVIFKKWQFSSLTDPHDKQLTIWPVGSLPSWKQCLQISCEALDGNTKNPVPGADSYYDISISAPNWATDETFVAQLGRVRFYNLDRDIEND